MHIIVIVFIIAFLLAAGSRSRANRRNALMQARATRRVEVELIRQHDPARYAALVTARNNKRLAGWIALAVIVIPFAIFVLTHSQ